MLAMGYFVQGEHPVGTGPFAAATLYRTLYGIAGAYLAARLAPNRPLMHALILGFLGFVEPCRRRSHVELPSGTRTRVVRRCAGGPRHSDRLDGRHPPPDAVRRQT
jgi:hypothetical protein